MGHAWVVGDKDQEDSMRTAGLRVTFLALFVAVAAPAIFAAPASAATKPYSLVICALGTNETCAPTPASSANAPAAAPVGDTSFSMTVTLTNENKLGTRLRLGSANLTPPTGFTVTGATLPASCSGCTVSIVGNVVKLRSLGVPPGGSVTVGMTVGDTAAQGCLVPNQVPNPTNSPLCAWTSEVKQSNDFSGPPCNDLRLDPSTSAPYTVLAHAAFANQPHNDILGQAISDSDFNPPPPAGTGGPVTVEIVDANGTVVTSYGGAVTLMLNTPNNPLTNPNPSTLGGTNPQNASAGIASFADLTVNESGNGYTLSASANDLPPSTTSNGFDVQQAGALCASSNSCQTQASSSNAAVTDGGVDVTVNSASGAASELTESIDFGSWPAATRILECGEASAHFAYEAFSIPRPLTTIVTTTDLELTKRNFSSAVNAQEICLAQSAPFMALDLGTKPASLTPAMAVTLPDGTPGYAGLEPNCGTKSNQVPQGTGPCVTGRSGILDNPCKGSGGTLTITDSSPTDRWGN
jgi:hypothetical protein